VIRRAGPLAAQTADGKYQEWRRSTLLAAEVAMVCLISSMESKSCHRYQHQRLLLPQGDPELSKSPATIGWICPSTILYLGHRLVLLLESLDPFLD